MAADGLITIPSSGTVKGTLDRLESEVKAQASQSSHGSIMRRARRRPGSPCVRRNY
jgi:hypothetical protein